MIIDYSTWKPSIATLQAAGVTAVGRYLGWDCQPGYQCIGKNLSRGEAQILLDAGIDIFLSFEYAADAALGGAAQGTKDAQLAAQQLHALGAPHGMTVYWALDFDIRDYAPGSTDPARKLGPAAAYFHAINAAKLPYKTGVYGGFYAVSRAMGAGLASMGWQTVAWSGGQWYAKAVLRQLAKQFMGYSDVDLHLATGDDFGQWPRPAPPAAGPVKVIADGKTTWHQYAVKHSARDEDLVWETARHMPSGWGPGQRPFIRDAIEAVAARAPAEGTIIWVP